MQAAVLRALEFDRIVEAVRGFALTTMGDERLARLAPASDPQKVGQLQAGTTEAVSYVAKYGTFPIRGSDDLPQILSALAVEGRALEGPRLLTLAAHIESIEETRASIKQVAPSYPLIERASAGVSSFKGETAQIRAKLDSAGG